MVLKVFVDLLSQPSRSVFLLLKCTGIEYQTVVTNLAQGDNRTDKYKKISPTRRVPAIQDGDYNLIESAAILKYICETRDIADHWYPKEQSKRSKIDEYLAWHHGNLRLGAAGLVFNLVFKPMLTGEAPSDVEMFSKIFKQSVGMFDKYFIKDTPFICSDDISIADLMAVTEFTQLQLLGDKSPSISENVQEWMSRCAKQTKPHFTDTHKLLVKMAGNLNPSAKL